MRILILAASLRKQSINAGLARLAADRLGRLNAQADVAGLEAFDAPLYNQDVLDAEGFPPGVRTFVARLTAADGFAIATPEYVFSMPGPLKNLIDWTSQWQPIPWTGKPGLLLSASSSSVGGQRGLWALRVPLEALGAYLYPDMFSLPQGGEALDPDGKFRDPTLDARLDAVLDGFAAFARSLSR